MSQSESATTRTSASLPAKKSAKVKKSQDKEAHPKTSVMVTNAIKNLKERNGSSLYAIKKYISTNYKIDAEKLPPFIRKFLKSAVTSGSLVQTKGQGASESFKLAPNSSNSTEKPTKTKPTEKPSSPKRDTTKKEPPSPKKPAPSKKKASSKLKPTVKTPTKKQKALKPKKISPATSKSKKPSKKAPKK